jgi:hypothetical protein
VRLSDTAVKAVAFIGVGGDDAFEPAGTCFFVCIGPNNYLVTADHVARTLGDGPFDVRLTRKKDGLAQCHRIEYPNWVRHPTQANRVDLTVLAFDFPEWATSGIISQKSFLTDFKRGTKLIGPGDLAYLVGLFQPLYGKRKNFPTVHTGHIALIQDDELLPVKNWLAPDPKKAGEVEIEAYLVQVQNPLPGVSGAPVFIRRSLKRRIYDNTIDPSPRGLEAWNHGSLWLLGIWTDAWFELLQAKAPSGGQLKIPTGMGAVVPMRKLIETLDHPDLLTQREEKQTKVNRKRAPEKTSLPLSKRAAKRRRNARDARDAASAQKPSRSSPGQE